jgi:hypothetical protein
VALLTVKGRNEDKVKLFAEHLRKALDAGLKDWKDLILAGPAPAPLLKAESFFRHQIMLRTSSMSRLSAELGKIEQAFAMPADLTPLSPAPRSPESAGKSRPPRVPPSVSTTYGSWGTATASSLSPMSCAAISAE